jgi:hypothetical protein
MQPDTPYHPTYHAHQTNLLIYSLDKRISSQKRRFLYFKPTKHYDRNPIRPPEALQAPIWKLRTSTPRAKPHQQEGSPNSWSHLPWLNRQHPRFLLVPKLKDR